MKITIPDSHETNDNFQDVLNTSIITDDPENMTDTHPGYWQEIKAIIGGVLGFWGGVGGLGAIFLTVVISQRYCCRKEEDEKDEVGG